MVMHMHDTVKNREDKEVHNLESRNNALACELCNISQ